jgi:hypothetical protein
MVFLLGWVKCVFAVSLEAHPAPVIFDARQRTGAGSALPMICIISLISLGQNNLIVDVKQPRVVGIWLSDREAARLNRPVEGAFSWPWHCCPRGTFFSLFMTWSMLLQPAHVVSCKLGR